MKNLLKVFAAIAMVAIGFVACEQAESNSISRVKDAAKYYGDDIYTTVNYEKNACFEIKLAKKTTALTMDNIKITVKNGNDEFPVNGIGVDLDSFSVATKSFKLLVNEVTPDNQTGTDAKNVDLSKNFKLVVKIVGAAYGEGGKDVVVETSKEVFKARSATATGDSISLETAYETLPAAKEITIKLTGCKIKDISAADLTATNNNNNIKGYVKVRVEGETVDNDLPEGIKVELVANDKEGNSETNNCMKSTDEFKVKISGGAENGKQPKGKLVFTLPADFIEGANLKFESSIEFEVKAPAQQGS